MIPPVWFTEFTFTEAASPRSSASPSITLMVELIRLLARMVTGRPVPLLTISMMFCANNPGMEMSTGTFPGLVMVLLSARPVLQQTVIPAGTTQADAVSTAYTVTTGAHAVIIGRWSVQWSIPDPNLLWSLIVNQNGVGQSVLTPAPLTGDADFQGDSSLFASLDISQNVTVSAYGPNTSQDITMTLTLTAIEITTAVWTSLVAPLLTIQQPAWLRQLAGGA